MIMMKPKPSTTRRAVALLLTLVVLIVLSAIMVQYHADAALQLRAMDYRRALQQCRYGAESGIIVGSVLANQTLLDLRQQRQDFGTVASESLDDDALTDPNGLADPNAAGPDGSAMYDLQPFIVNTIEKELSGVDVTIEIHDENGKWPVVWLLRSPFTGSANSRKPADGFEAFVDDMGIMDIDADAVTDLLRQIGQPLNFPASEILIEIPSGSTSARRGAVRSRSGDRVKLRRTSYRRRRADSKRRYAALPVLVNQWYTQTRSETWSSLREPLAVEPGIFSDYISAWGSCQINLNAAPVSVIYSAFSPFGLTYEQAQRIVDLRVAGPIVSVTALDDLDLPTDLRDIMKLICVVESRVYSIHVTARLGRAEVHMTGGVYFSNGRVVKRVAVTGG